VTRAAAAERLDRRALNRALLARQHLLDRFAGPLPEAVESAGALQAQHWPAIPVALWSRVRDLRLDALYAALDARELLMGTLIRGTLHVVSAREHPAYAAVADAAGADGWSRAGADAPDQVDVPALCEDLVAHAAAGGRPLALPELGAFIEEWVGRRAPAADGAWLARTRGSHWRPFRTASAFVRAPADGGWTGRAPETSLAVRCVPHAWPRPAAEEALGTVVRRHLRAFGPAAAEDVASWIGRRTPPVREALRRLEPDLVRLEDEAGRPLFDLPDAPRPGPDAAAPPRFLPAFDSSLLAYASGRRERILPEAYRDRVYLRANLQVLPTFLLDGLVAGTWSVRVARRTAVLTLVPFAPLPRSERAALLEEAERLVRFCQPAAVAHRVEPGD